MFHSVWKLNNLLSLLLTHALKKTETVGRVFWFDSLLLYSPANEAQYIKIGSEREGRGERERVTGCRDAVM